MGSMKFLKGKDRHQVEISTLCLDETVEPNNPVRVIDAFVDSLPLEGFGFRLNYGEDGRPAYHPADLLKLFIYGYQNRIRSSRALEKECRRNIELIWLLKALKPDHNTIARFRKDNPEAIRHVFRATVETARNFNLIGGTLLAGDSTKLRAQNSKKNNYNQKKIKRHLEYIDRKLEEYTGQLKEADGEPGEEEEQKKERQEKKKEAKEGIKKHLAQRKRYENLQLQLEQSGEEQISTSDPESRQMIIRGQITEVAYNVQATVDSKHHIPLDYHVTNNNDSKAMGYMLERAVDIIGHSSFTALYDKGYHTASEFEKAANLGVEVMVAIPAVSSHAPHPLFDLEQFTYIPKKDHYRCPMGKILRSNGRWYNSSREGGSRFKQYKTTGCKRCHFRSSCTKSSNGRILQRSENAHLTDQNRERITKNPDIYRKRQSIVEHPFGTIKRQWGFDHIMTKKTKEHASADVGLIFIAYNLKRLMNLLSPAELKGRFFHSSPLIWHLKSILVQINANRRSFLLFWQESPRLAIFNIFNMAVEPACDFK